MADRLIDDMWSGFTVSDYVPVKRRAVLSVTNSPPLNFTVPVPFSMTLREEKRDKKKSRSMVIADRERVEKQAIEEGHLSKQFKANPVPATTLLPLYDLITVRNQQRREQVKRNSKQLLEMSQKPFSFTIRDQLKTRSVSTQPKIDSFHAQEIPQGLFDEDTDERIKEQKVYRKIRIRLRAMETLADSHEMTKHYYSLQKFPKIKHHYDTTFT